jgi:hypothetical protein
MRIASDGRGKILKRSFRLSSTERAKLATAVRKADLASAKSPKGMGCCDLFYYAIRYRGHAFEWDDTARVPSRIADLATMLSRLYEKYES